MKLTTQGLAHAVQPRSTWDFHLGVFSFFLKTKQEQTKRTPTCESRGIRNVMRANGQIDIHECDATMHRCVAIVDLQTQLAGDQLRHCPDLQRNGK